ncbi:Bifunctional inhibitor/lipid-transfer protein/seed storage 2S albumin superfamily protein [Perilla frutescens var. hirtella]|uniref:Bifunctional inhibitor/lipid-transfer protein/seed storage 2S albumin superfamily protein n=1 Tax=Perilla frutescens var. hirtella TaxID=608512 RepID=A0AAD4IZ52_PERFH|nr:Bifunctional inhibitor/lipid-transfer protein/seed storage 2S albumin superfamily protein [Perilla frutescens var. hirtella]
MRNVFGWLVFIFVVQIRESRNLRFCSAANGCGSGVERWTARAWLKTVVKTNPHCLCDAFNNSAQLGVTLNLTKALALPAACHVSAPSLSNFSTGIGAAPDIAHF